MWRSEDNLWEGTGSLLVLCGLDWTLVVRLGNRCLCCINLLVLKPGFLLRTQGAARQAIDAPAPTVTGTPGPQEWAEQLQETW